MLPVKRSLFTDSIEKFLEWCCNKDESSDYLFVKYTMYKSCCTDIVLQVLEGYSHHVSTT